MGNSGSPSYPKTEGILHELFSYQNLPRGVVCQLASPPTIPPPRPASPTMSAVATTATVSEPTVVRRAGCHAPLPLFQFFWLVAVQCPLDIAWLGCSSILPPLPPPLSFPDSPIGALAGAMSDAFRFFWCAERGPGCTPALTGGAGR